MMQPKNLSRRNFVTSSLYGLALASIPHAPSFGQTIIPRVDWETFKIGKDYLSFYNAIGKMRSNTNPSDPASLQYWTNVHVNYCPHGVPYFYAWHRGYLYYFEQQLRLVSGNKTLTLPYWDYYAKPTIPAEFTDPAPTNPFYVERVNTNISPALTMAPFSDLLTNFQRGTVNAFESSIETRPHNPVHDLIGGWMATMQSPLDPIFYLHHANIDRYWNAWVAAGKGRQMPPSTDAYWVGPMRYATNLTMNRSSTINTRTKMSYFYDYETFPLALPPAASMNFEPVQLAMAGGIGELSMLGIGGNLGGNLGGNEPNAKRAPRRPQQRLFTSSPARIIDAKRKSIGGVKDVALDESSVSAKVSFDAADSLRLQNIFKKAKSTPFSRAPATVEPYRSVQIVLDNVNLSEIGKKGGFFYNIFVNLPETDTGASEERYLLGTVGPFNIAGSLHHGNFARLSFPATQLLQDIAPANLNELVISFVRVSGKNSPKGQILVLGEARIELSDDDIL